MQSEEDLKRLKEAQATARQPEEKIYKDESARLYAPASPISPEQADRVPAMFGRIMDRLEAVERRLQELTAEVRGLSSRAFPSTVDPTAK